MIKVLIVDDHALVRMGIKRLLEEMQDVQVVGDLESGKQALKFVKTSCPDIVLLDMKMPGIDGWEVTRRLKKTNPNVKVIALTAVSSEPFPTRVLQLGAMGYLTKDSVAADMEEAIRKVAKGEMYLSAQIAQKMAISSVQETQDNPFDKLSEREMQVMLMITQGISVLEIANELCLSTKTVNGFRYRLFEKLQINNDVQLTYLALKNGLIESPN